MEQSVKSSWNFNQYQTPNCIIVNNQYTDGDQMIWAKAIASCMVESAAFFDGQMRLIDYNNKFGTLSAATQRDLIDLDSLFAYYGRFYINADDCREAVRKVFLLKSPIKFTMHHYSGLDCDCSCYPVLEGMQLKGVVLLANRNRHERESALPIGANLRGQQPSK